MLKMNFFFGALLTSKALGLRMDTVLPDPINIYSPDMIAAAQITAEAKTESELEAEAALQTEFGSSMAKGGFNAVKNMGKGLLGKAMGGKRGRQASGMMDDAMGAMGTMGLISPKKAKLMHQKKKRDEKKWMKKGKLAERKKNMQA